MNVIGELNKTAARFRFLYWAVVLAAILLIGFLVGGKKVWMIGVAAGLLSSPISRAIQKRKYASLLRRIQQERTCFPE